MGSQKSGAELPIRVFFLLSLAPVVRLSVQTSDSLVKERGMYRCMDNITTLLAAEQDCGW